MLTTCKSVITNGHSPNHSSLPQQICIVKAWPNWTTLFVNMSIIMLVECSWTFHVFDRSGLIGQHCSPTNSIRHKLNAVYVDLAAV